MIPSCLKGEKTEQRASEGSGREDLTRNKSSGVFHEERAEDQAQRPP